jgi:hypothetical protein
MAPRARRNASIWIGQEAAAELPMPCGVGHEHRVFSFRCAEAPLFIDKSHEVYSKLSSFKTFGNSRVDVQIFRLDFYHLWALEVVTEWGGSLVWDELFVTDEEALGTFEAAAEELGLARLLRNAHWEICRSDAKHDGLIALSNTSNAKGSDRLNAQPYSSTDRPSVPLPLPHYERG